MSADLVEALPERRRILSEPLALSAWTAGQRRIYALMIEAESRYIMLDEAEMVANIAPGATVAQMDRSPITIRARATRERRRCCREAVTALRGAVAVTTGKLDQCIVCGAALNRRTRWHSRRRRDAAYCSPACRQKAYRLRRAAS